MSTFGTLLILGGILLLNRLLGSIFNFSGSSSAKETCTSWRTRGHVRRLSYNNKISSTFVRSHFCKRRKFM